jgi:hypothetical protein
VGQGAAVKPSFPPVPLRDDKTQIGEEIPPPLPPRTIRQPAAAAKTTKKPPPLPPRSTQKTPGTEPVKGEVTEESLAKTIGDSLVSRRESLNPVRVGDVEENEEETDSLFKVEEPKSSTTQPSEESRAEAKPEAPRKARSPGQPEKKWAPGTKKPETTVSLEEQLIKGKKGLRPHVEEPKSKAEESQEDGGILKSLQKEIEKHTFDVQEPEKEDSGSRAAEEEWEVPENPDEK